MGLPATNAAALQMVCPALYARGAAVYQGWLDLADGQLATAAEGWNDQRTLAVAYLAAHSWLRATGGSEAGISSSTAEAVGAVAGEAAGDRSRSYAGIATKTLEDAELVTTRFGAAFVRLRTSRPGFGARILTL